MEKEGRGSRGGRGSRDGGRGGGGRGGGGRGGGRGGGGRGGGGGGGKGGVDSRLLSQFPHLDKATKARIAAECEGRDADAVTLALVAEDERRFLAAHPRWEEEASSSDATTHIAEIRGDLFTSTDSLAHCVSECLAMGKGVATGFKELFGGVDELKAQGVLSGGVAFLKRDDRFIYYLVTKKRYWMKPSYENVWSSLQRLRDLCLEHGVRNLSMPVIAAGLDRLRWPRVKEMIERAFANTNINITIYIWDGK